jgi:hypothetical protein
MSSHLLDTAIGGGIAISVLKTAIASSAKSPTITIRLTRSTALMFSGSVLRKIKKEN